MIWPQISYWKMRCNTRLSNVQVNARKKLDISRSPSRARNRGKASPRGEPRQRQRIRRGRGRLKGPFGQSRNKVDMLRGNTSMDNSKDRAWRA